jgi:hypothetical protein
MSIACGCRWCLFDDVRLAYHAAATGSCDSGQIDAAFRRHASRARRRTYLGGIRGRRRGLRRTRRRSGFGGSRGSGWSGGGRGGRFIDLAKYVVDGHDIAIVLRLARQDTAFECRHLYGNFISLQLDQCVARSDRIPLLLEPTSDRRFDDRFSERGHLDRYHSANTSGRYEWRFARGARTKEDRSAIRRDANASGQ